MNHNGLVLCSRYANPPNSLHLCGPEKQNDLSWYDANLKSDQGTVEILKEFSTLYPYLKLIAEANHLDDPFDTRVVRAYWIGNELLKAVSPTQFTHHLEDALQLTRKIGKKQISVLYNKFPTVVFPHHSFHVLNIYHRTGHVVETHTIQTMDACIINWGTVANKLSDSLVIKTKPLQQNEFGLGFGDYMLRKIKPVGMNDKLFQKVKPGDVISYHWGMLCSILTKNENETLQFYTSESIKLANKKSLRPLHLFSL